MRFSARNVACTLALTLSGCGALPEAPVSAPPGRLPSGDPVGPPSAPPALPAPAVPTEAAFRQNLNAVLSTLSQSATSFEARYATEERVKSDYRKTVYRMLFQQQPRVSLLEVLESNHLPKGFKVRSTGSDTVQVRLPGAVSFVRLEVAARSNQSRSLMGLYPDDVTPEKFVNILMDPSTQVRELPGRAVEGRPLRMLEALGPRAIVRGAALTVGLGEGPRFAYHLAIAQADGSRHVQTFTRLQARRFSSKELDL
ncbi:MAG: hypothetical protein VKP62_12310 [Candidatus Sericytochromatia bacterium]|nr:hypothetical protein [Candidatus Sericytochromatia bacterium]